MVREGLKALLASEGVFRVVGEAGDGFETLQQVVKLKPAILLLDLMMPRLQGLEVLRQLPAGLPTRAIIVTMHAGEPYVLEALKSGAFGYILKQSPATELIEAIRRVGAGEHYLSPSLRSVVLKASYGPALQNPPSQFKGLTPRERLVLPLAAEGKSTKEIGSALHISHRTVETHRANLMAKLGLKSQTDVVRYAIRNHIIEA